MLKYTGKARGINGEQCFLLDGWPTDCEATRLPNEEHELNRPVPTAPDGDGKDQSAGEMQKSNFLLSVALLISLSLPTSLQWVSSLHRYLGLWTAAEVQAQAQQGQVRTKKSATSNQISDDPRNTSLVQGSGLSILRFTNLLLGINPSLGGQVKCFLLFKAQEHSKTLFHWWCPKGLPEETWGVKDPLQKEDSHMATYCCDYYCFLKRKAIFLKDFRYLFLLYTI